MEHDPTGNAGVHLAGLLIEHELEWVFREQPVSDFGIDAHLETTDEHGKVTGRLIALQIKTGESYMRESAHGLTYYGKLAHLNYWLNHALPVVLLVCDLETRTTYWQHINSDTIEYTEKAWKVVVPLKQVLTSDSKDEISRIAAGSVYQTRLSRLIIDRRLIQHAAGLSPIYVEIKIVAEMYEEAGMHLVIYADKMKDRQLSIFGYQASADVAETLRALFPWAAIKIDDLAYSDEDLQRYEELCALRDSADEEPYGYTEQFDEWIKSQPAIRPHADGDLVATNYSLELEANELGRAFLVLDRYLNIEYGEDDDAVRDDDVRI